jgi:hypothetical protein
LDADACNVLDHAGADLYQALADCRELGRGKRARLRIANALVDIREARGRSWTDSTKMRWYHLQLVLDAVDNRCVGTYMGPMMHDDVHKFVARSEAEWRAHIAAAIEAARAVGPGRGC